ncbi:late embryogenesis abundant protein At1g64065-like [Olea europaea var. sylvestris]|uniref:late embryogenesis abundant protein At1g64065-like n=1 Tax=Olea europaea var. sylvestris TaxID=158386 RepID=UPI000C1D4D27|nr:late embryogenesis abundant protein At1g64065-like [Olea europaea var. sylvestris]
MAAEKYQQGYPLAPASVMPRSDEESAAFRSIDEHELKKKKRLRCFAYIAIFAVFQTAIILVFALTVMRFKTPKVRLGDVSISRANGTDDFRLTARVLVRNRNFGHYKFDDTMATIKSGDATVGEFIIPESRARARSTKRLYIIADINFSSGNNSGFLPLSVEAKLRGKVRLIKVIKRNKSADMNCTMSINMATNSVQDLNCE